MGRKIMYATWSPLEEGRDTRGTNNSNQSFFFMLMTISEMAWWLPYATNGCSWTQILLCCPLNIEPDIRGKWVSTEPLEHFLCNWRFDPTGSHLFCIELDWKQPDLELNVHVHALSNVPGEWVFLLLLQRCIYCEEQVEFFGISSTCVHPPAKIPTIWYGAIPDSKNFKILKHHACFPVWPTHPNHLPIACPIAPHLWFSFLFW